MKSNRPFSRDIYQNDVYTRKELRTSNILVTIVIAIVVTTAVIANMYMNGY